MLSGQTAKHTCMHDSDLGPSARVCFPPKAAQAGLVTFAAGRRVQPNAVCTVPDLIEQNARHLRRNFRKHASVVLGKHNRDPSDPVQFILDSYYAAHEAIDMARPTDRRVCEHHRIRRVKSF